MKDVRWLNVQRLSLNLSIYSLLPGCFALFIIDFTIDSDTVFQLSLRRRSQETQQKAGTSGTSLYAIKSRDFRKNSCYSD